jgi:hypothetical protein
LKEVDKGMGIAVVRQHYSARNLMICFIKENDERIRASVI